MLLLAMMTLAVVQVAFVMYARNTLAAAAHEGARIAIERNQDPEVAVSSVEGVVKGVVGGLVEDVDVAVETAGGHVRVLVSGRVDAIGPLPLAIPLSQQASALLFDDP